MIVDLINEKEVEDQIEEIEKEIFGKYKPIKFQGADGYEVKEIKSFEKTCVFLQQNGIHKHAKEMTAFELLQSVEIVRQQIKKSLKDGKSNFNKRHSKR